MKKTLVEVIVIILFVFSFQIAGASENIFEKEEHCLAYRTIKGMFWVADVEVIGKSCKVDSKIQWSEDKKLFQLEVSVPIESFDSDSGMRDKAVMEILKADLHPNIRFISSWLAPQEFKQEILSGQIKLPGKLEIAGEQYIVEFPLTVAKLSDDTILEGTLVSSFSYFNIAIPSVGLGGIIAEPSDVLEIHVHLHANQLMNVNELLTFQAHLSYPAFLHA